MTLPVEVTDLTLRYGDTTALDRLSLRLAGGRIHGLIGRNGSGKTSLLSVLAAFRRPTAGSVRVGGQTPYENERITRRICLIRGSGDVFESERCREVLRLAGALRPDWDRAYAESLLERFGLPARRKVQQLSRGQRSALGCVIGLASRAPLTIFDESYLGMDAPSRYLFYEELLRDYAEHPRTVILSTHLVEEFESLFEEVVIIHDGRVLLHDDVDHARTRGVAVTGPAEAVDRFVRATPATTGVGTRAAGAAAGRPDSATVLNERRLGDTKQVTVLGTPTDEQRQRAAADGLRLEPVPLQDLFVRLTTGKEAA